MPGTSDMVPIYFTNRPNPVVLAKDGRINFLPFDMIPDTIVVNGFKGLVGNDGLSVIPIKELVNLGYLQLNAGTPLDPLRVEGKPLTGDKGFDKETWAPALLTLPRLFGFHIRTSAGPGTYQALAGKQDRTV